jgi:hypothetical protein
VCGSAACKVPVIVVRFEKTPNFNVSYTFRQFLEKYSDFNFHENPSRGNRVVCGGWGGQEDMKKQVHVSLNFANAPN